MIPQISMLHPSAPARTTGRILPLLVACCIALLTPKTGSLALTTGNPGSEPLVSEPCGVLPEGGLCFQGAITQPSDREELTILPGQTDLVFRGVAERDTQVYVYFIKGDGTLVNELPFEATAGHDGVFVTDKISLILLLSGSGSQEHFRGAAYYRTSIAEHPNGETFFQLTGNPIVRFSVMIPPPPTPGPQCGDNRLDLPGEGCDDGNTQSGDGCSATCVVEVPPRTCPNNVVDRPGEDCDPPNGVDCSPTCRRIRPPGPICGNGIVDPPDEECDLGADNGQADSGCSGACKEVPVDCSVKLDFSNVMEGGSIVRYKGSPHSFAYLTTDNSGQGEAARIAQLIYEAAYQQMKKAVCAAGADSDATKWDETFTFYFGPVGGQYGTVRSRADGAVRAILDSSACTAGDMAGMDPIWGKFGGDARSYEDNISGVFLGFGENLVRFPQCTKGGVKYRVTYVTGSSPLIFVTSPVPVEATVQVAPRGGVVTVADPPQTNGAWRVTAGAAASPLYYEFSDGVLGQLALRDDEGWTVEAGAAESLLRSLLLSWGYDPAEVETFLARDVRGKLPGSGTLEVRVADPSVVSQVLPLAVTPTPARVERVLFHLHAVTDPRELQEPDVSALLHAGATGLTVREFGAVFVGG